MTDQTGRADRQPDACVATFEVLLVTTGLAAIPWTLFRFGKTWAAVYALMFALSLVSVGIATLRAPSAARGLCIVLIVIGVAVNTKPVFAGPLGAIEGTAVGFGIVIGIELCARAFYPSAERAHTHTLSLSAIGAWLGVAAVWQAALLAVLLNLCWRVPMRNKPASTMPIASLAIVLAGLVSLNDPLMPTGQWLQTVHGVSLAAHSLR
ncbi:hypothetical protein [Pararobbsia silviterrae]|uniref:Uncharacterized protein n=1 Tax=Pararobbsia silviterrae TaxID=1792498 RepID=A0A494Y5H4_9BURK|nr:hypothetical protein [Pararobbsia silviterrae]RKP55821.1 hypothetical protein D7S86_11450 [Pararobbsia silviterrae]